MLILAGAIWSTLIVAAAVMYVSAPAHERKYVSWAAGMTVGAVALVAMLLAVGGESYVEILGVPGLVFGMMCKPD